ncbi:glycosyl hydrolase family 61-domain-containing protein [Pseudoneurospora amorphoporcata]|uniref:lytic cellulose monooxygenase (C4-dehydrogenating) n=1 Tax=Pseudoneurospora amorphoporcata TaxID=241081 RepID=A0AAN6NY38_9PEZI|nr:glycosyl hydrolase family 61-domain-containing protein [Pseudoneurospora amorphoporcata]
MKVLSLLAAASAASAHTIFVQLEAGGTTYPVSHGIRTPSYDGPITDVTSNDLACNGGPNPTTPSDKIITVNAGSTVKAIWRHTLTSGADDVMDASHKGPTLAYLKKVNNALTDTGIGNGWFKIQEDGYNNGQWGTSTVISNGGFQYIDIPACIPNGQYLLRAEMIALHAASSTAGAQLYMECAQINIVGGTGTASPSTYSIPGIYMANDPGLLINIYSMGTSSAYTIPGPAKFTCSGGGGSGSNPTTTAKVSSTSAAATSTSKVAVTTSTTLKTSVVGQPTGCTAAQWAQCGGIGFSGCTTCASPYTCKKQNDYYSQCS